MDPRFITPANRNNESTDHGTSADKRRSYGDDLIDFLSVLSEFNCRRMKDRILPGTLPFMSLRTTTVELFFNICSSFQMPPDVKYLALEIFDK